MANILDKLIEMLIPRAHDNIDAQIQKARDIRPKVRKNVFNQSGTISSHLMSSSGKYAFPMLFPKDPTSKTTTGAYDDWIEYPEWAWKQAMDEAKIRGELFSFLTEGEAEKFAKGIWKPK